MNVLLIFILIILLIIILSIFLRFTTINELAPSDYNKFNLENNGIIVIDKIL